MSTLTEYGDFVFDGLDEWGRVKTDGILEDGTFVFGAGAPPVVTETIIAQDFPMQYGIGTASELRSKVTGQTTVVNVKEFPTSLVKRGKQNELSSDFAA